jgi:hypothetical protein
MNFSTGHSVVDAVGELRLTGNVVHHSWYQHVRYSNKRGEFTDPWAVLILADIVYWHRPIEIRDEHTGHLVGYRKKFAEDKLQRSPKAFSELLHCSEKVVREALALLENLELIDIELRAIRTGFGVIPTAMFIGLNPERLKEITHGTSKPETLEKSLLPKSAKRNPEIGNKHCRNGKGELPKSVTQDSEMGNSSISRDFSIDSSTDFSEEATTPKQLSVQVEVLEPEQATLGTLRCVEEQKQIDWLETSVIPRVECPEGEYVESNRIDVALLKEIEQLAHNPKKRPWRLNSFRFKPEMEKAVYKANPEWYSIQGSAVPNEKKICDRLKRLENDLAQLNETAVNAYNELFRYWRMASHLDNPLANMTPKQAKAAEIYARLSQKYNIQEQS